MKYYISNLYFLVLQYFKCMSHDVALDNGCEKFEQCIN
uniref:Uncharacterized protein n=1 Tax=Arundo donax TaxID=35708 RepID=A0A0A9GNB3_ARUDO